MELPQENFNVHATKRLSLRVDGIKIQSELEIQTYRTE